MSQLPVIVGFGGISPAGRSSFHHAYRRLILDQLDSRSRQETVADLATLMGLALFEEDSYVNQDGEKVSLSELAQALEPQVRAHTLIRRIEAEHFDADRVPCNRPAEVSNEDPIRFIVRNRQLPQQIPDSWSVREISARESEVIIKGGCELTFPDHKPLAVQSAGQLPSGFQPGKLYQSRNHPRALQLTVFSSSDALNSTGLELDEIMQHIAPDEVAVYASNSMSQMDDLGFGGMFKYPLMGKRITSKQMPLGFAQMPADFVNAYLLGNVGETGGSMGACATFLYNLRSAVQDIREGRRKLALVGGSDAPILPEVIEGFRAMGALAEDKDLLMLDEVEELNEDSYRRACRPFGQNAGFTIGESSQFVVLMSDDLALEMGAQIFGAVPDVFVNADGHKKSISAPGVGNYITLGKTAALLEKLIGSEGLRQRTFVQAHGTSTPQNRVTESHVINETAKAFGIEHWPVTAMKAYLGHSQGVAAADQMVMSLGTWAYGWIPGITTTAAIADDVHTSNLNFLLEHTEVGAQGMDAVLLNAKGFGGNNASAPVLAPHITEQMLAKRHGEEAIADWRSRREASVAKAAAYDADAIKGLARPTYRYDHNVLAGEDLTITAKEIQLPGYANAVSLDVDTPYEGV